MRTVSCLLCHRTIAVPDLPPYLYINHLKNQHDVVYDVDWIIQRTFALQQPSHSQSPVSMQEDSSPGPATRLQQTLPPSVSITPVYKRRPSDVTTNDDNATAKREQEARPSITLYNETSITPKECAPAWSLGCVYKCQICQVKFQTLSSFQSHLFFHSLSVSQYTCMWGDAGVSVQHHTCHVCGHVVQQDPAHLNDHLATHGVSLTSYTDQYMGGQDNPEAEVISTISSTSKSSPVFGENVRQSVDNISEASNHSQQQQQIRGVQLAEPEEEEGSEAGDDDSSSVEELMEIPEPQIEIQEGEYPSTINTGDLSIIESIAESNREFMENAMRFFQQQVVTPAPLLSGMVAGQSQHNGHGDMFRSSDWADKCVYQCRICQPPLMFDTHSKMSYHVKKRHNMAMKDYTTQFGRAMIHEEKHCCQICGSHVLWERSSIYQHIYQVHNKVSMEQYGKLMLDYKPNLNTNNTGDSRAAHRQSSSTNSEPGNVDWTNECVFECKLCQPGRKFNSKNKISFHIKRSHGLKMTEYNSMYGTCLVSRSWHTCQICGISILCDYFSIYQHLTKAHRVSLQDYHNQLMTNYDAERVEWLNRCTFGCKLCHQEFQFRSDFTDHIATDHQMTLNSYTKEFGSLYKLKKIHICQIKSCGKKFYWETLALKAHIEKRHEMQVDEYFERFMKHYDDIKCSSSMDPDAKEGSETVDARINQCEYLCYLCNETFDLDRYFADHLKTVHNISKHDYKASFGSSLSKKVLQNCQLCKCNPKEFLIDQAYLGVHIRTTHKESINTYLQILEAAQESSLGLNDEVRPEEEWCYQCRFICCQTVFSQKWRFDRHVGSNHGITTSEFFEHMRSSPGYFIKKQFHKCFVCSKEILFDKSPIQSHIRGHDLSLDEYYDQFVAKQGTGTREPTWLSIAIHHDVQHTCQICHENISWDQETITGHLGQQHDTTVEQYQQQYMQTYKFNQEATSHMLDVTNWADKNTWICQADTCHMQLSSRVKLVLHIRRSHTLTALEYFRQHKDSLTTDVQHTCQLCTTKILWDSYYLREHLRIKHKMKMLTYKHRVVNNYNANITAAEAKQNGKKLRGRPVKRKKKRKVSDDEDDEIDFENPGEM